MVELDALADTFSSYQHEMFDLSRGSIVEGDFTRNDVYAITFEGATVLAPRALTDDDITDIFAGNEAWVFSDGGILHKGKQRRTNILDFGYR